MAADPDISELLRKIGEDLKIINAPRAEPIQVSLQPDSKEIYAKSNYCRTCAKEGITKRAYYNFDGEKVGIYCKKHKICNMIDVKNRRCLITGCKTRPSFNIKGKTKGIYCFVHKQPNMICITITCHFPNCMKQPAYNYEGETSGIFCATHKHLNMINVKTPSCLFTGCKVLPSFGIEGGAKKYCEKHKKPGMINIHQSCIFVGCKTRPNFNNKGEKKGIYCAKHMLPGMVNVIDKTCIYPDCKKQPIYNIEGESKGIYCNLHRQPNMINVVDATCKFIGCKIRPVFNNEWEKRGIYCSLHKLPNMIDVLNRTCFIVGCKTRPVYNINGLKFGLYCYIHKSPDMIDVVNKSCQQIDCKKEPKYGLPLQKRTHCFTHREEGMLRRPKQKCIISGCKEYSFYGIHYPLHCETHKLPDELNMVEKKCSSCGLIMVLNQNNLCQYCGDFIHKRVHLVKQTAVKNFFDANELKYDSYDKVYDRECGLERPDFVFDRKEFVIIVEVDENQHRSYLEECECSRMVNIYNSFGGARVMFIRYNPDKYTGEQYTDNQRLDILKTCLINMAWNPSPLPLTFVKLFFDGFEVAKTNITEIPVI